MSILREITIYLFCLGYERKSRINRNISKNRHNLKTLRLV